MLAWRSIAIPVATGLIDVVQRYYSARAGEGIIFDLRQQMYGHLQRMSLRFFTHTKSGEIVSRFNSDVVGAQNAVTGTIPNIVTNVVTLVSTLVDHDLHRVAADAAGGRRAAPLPAAGPARGPAVLRTIRRQAMEYNAEMSNIISETLSINGALLVKTFGRQPPGDGALLRGQRQGARHRHPAGHGGALVLHGAGHGRRDRHGADLLGRRPHGHRQDAITIGTIVAFAAYLSRLYGPISSLSNVQVEFATVHGQLRAGLRVPGPAGGDRRTSQTPSC